MGGQHARDLYGRSSTILSIPSQALLAHLVTMRWGCAQMRTPQLSSMEGLEMGHGNVREFDSPPVRETAMAVEFAPIYRMDTTRLVHLLDSLAEGYPERDDQPPLPPSRQSEEQPTFTPTMMLGIGWTPTRLWAVNNELGYVLQLQQDRLILNWRSGGAPYPRFVSLKREFKEKWDGLLTFCEKNGLPDPEPHTVEFTYVNVIGNDGQTRPTQALRSLADAEESLPGMSAGVAYNTRRILSDGSDQGSLSVSASHDESPEWLLTITTRLSVRTADPIEMLSRAHELSRDAFLGVTTPEAQDQWGAR